MCYSAWVKNKPKQLPKNNDMETVTSKPTFPMRINKYLALQKVTTRRGADELIEKKQVFINNRLAVLGDKVNAGDNVEMRYRGKPKPFLYFAYHKPKGIVTSLAQRHDKEIRDVLNFSEKDLLGGVKKEDIFPIGRLDKESHGLIILTNDGRITERLLGPEFEHEKEYIVTTKEKLRTSFKEKMEAGVKIEGETEPTKPCRVTILDEKKFRVVLTEGKKHQIRRMCVALFQEVDELRRVRIMNIQLGNLPEGQYRPIVDTELQDFLHQLELA
jgi:23S rRNA pseudouridine2604 synthase